MCRLGPVLVIQAPAGKVNIETTRGARDKQSRAGGEFGVFMGQIRGACCRECF